MNNEEFNNEIKNGRDTFPELFKLYYKPIFGYIFRRTGNFDDTADIAADTFLKAFRHFDKFVYKGVPIKAWLYRIATNETNLYYRYRQKNTSLVQRIVF